MAWVDREALRRRAAERQEVVPVESKTLGGTVGVRVLGGRALARFTDEYEALEQDSNEALYVFACEWLKRLIVGEDGQPLFGEGDLGLDEAAELLELALTANGMTEEAAAEAEAGFSEAQTAEPGSA